MKYIKNKVMRKSVVLLVFSLMLVSVYGQTDCYTFHRKKGIDAYNAGDYAKAKEYFAGIGQSCANIPANNDINTWIGKCDKEIAAIAENKRKQQKEQERLAREQREREVAAERERLAREQREREAAAEREAIAKKERLERETKQREKEERLKQYTIFTTFDKIMIVKKNNLYGAVDLNGYVKIELKYANVLQAKDNGIDIIKYYNKSFNNYDIYDKTGNFIKTTTR
jgi:hypothetical protein